jgi:ABC-type nitrate/sulfonate/bicarbonate transport system substrate-binding protein
MVLFVIVWLGAVACAPASAQERVRLALSVRNVVFLPFYYAKDTKIFDKHGLNVEIIQMRSDLQLAGLASGEVDYTPSIGPAGAAFAMACRSRRWRYSIMRRFSLSSARPLSQV